ncbi:hypothetical protein [Streptomyces sp. NPDC058623]|uniref:hypothetical protein n=1 Tax=Streptomyces sp. NPDC058623 TaxID=3346563 RepID=UPI0036553E7B
MGPGRKADCRSRRSFEASQRRATARARTAATLAARPPAYYVALDLLQEDGAELLTLPRRKRRRRSEVLFGAEPGDPAGPEVGHAYVRLLGGPLAAYCSTRLGGRRRKWRSVRC